MNTRSVFVLLCSAFLALSCDVNSADEAFTSDPAKVHGKFWQWTGYLTTSGAHFKDVEADNGFELVSDVEAEGKTACWQFWSDYAIDSTSLRFEMVLIKPLGCEPTPKSFAEFLLEPARYLVSDSQLVVIPRSDEVARLFFKAR